MGPSKHNDWRRALPWMLLTLLAAGRTVAVGQEGDPVASVLRLVPREAGVTLVVPALREHAREILGSPLVERLTELPAWRAWLETPAGRRLQTARAEVEAALGADLATVRDELLGDAVALTMVWPPGEDDPDAADGLLLTRVRQRPLLDRLVQRVNELERNDGTLAKVVERRHRGVAYQVRMFQPGTRPDDYHAVLGDDIFAWTSSEALLRGAIDRQLDGGGLDSEPRAAAMRAALPTRSLATLLVDPLALTRFSGELPEDDPAVRLLSRYARALTYVGAALEWKDGPILHIREALDPALLDEPLRRWAARPGGAGVLVRRVPRSAPVLAAGHVDFSAAGDWALGLVPEAERGRAESVLAVLQGIFLGLDIRSEILPRLGPGLLAYVGEPDGPEEFPLVIALGLGGSPEDRPSLGAAVDNALRTLLALATLDAKRGPAARLASREVHGVRVTSLVGGSRPVSYAVGPGFVALGTTPEAVGAFAGEPPAGGNPTLDRLREAYFPDAETYLCADLDALRRLAIDRREALTRRLAGDRGGDTAAARRDLDAALDLIGLFHAAFAVSRMEPDASAAHRMIGLVAPAGWSAP